MTAFLSGSDEDVNLPQTFAGSRIFNTASGGDVLSTETFTSFTLEADEDEITVRHQLQVPLIE